jgi:hypothetical protein
LLLICMWHLSFILSQTVDFNIQVALISFKPVDRKNAIGEIEVSVTTQKNKSTDETFAITFPNTNIEKIWIPISPMNSAKYQFKYSLSGDEIFESFLKSEVPEKNMKYYNAKSNKCELNYLSRGVYTGTRLLGPERYEVYGVWKNYYPYDWGSINYEFSTVNLSEGAYNIKKAKESLINDFVTNSAKQINSSLGHRIIRFNAKDVNSRYPVNSNNVIYKILIKGIPSLNDYNNHVDKMMMKIFETLPEGIDFSEINKDEIIDRIKKELKAPYLDGNISFEGGPTYDVLLNDLGNANPWNFSIEVSCNGYYFVSQKFILKKTE